MREISLNGKQYKLVSGSAIAQEPINPFMARWAGAGGITYENFQQATPEEYFDFRKGIGKKRGLGSDNKLDWSEGIDFTTEGQAVLGSFVTTAGAFGVAPSKIFDFQSNTYAVGSSQISKWDATSSLWTSVDTSLATPLDTIVITDSTDEYALVCSSSDGVITTDGTTWTDSAWWVTPTGTVDPDTAWTNPSYANDDNTATYANAATANGHYLELTHAALWCDRVRFWVLLEGAGSSIDVDLYYESAWHNIHSGNVTEGAWVTKKNSAGLKSVTAMRIRTNDAATYGRIYEADFGCPIVGYMTEFANRLYCITTDGKGVSYSASKDIDTYGGFFQLTGNYGTVYDLFEGKLLADGTSAVYFTSTEGLFSVDTTNGIAYKQEVAYPTLTYSGHKGLYANAAVWVATGYGILKVPMSGDATFVGPDLGDGLPSGYQGYIYDMAFVNNWLIYCVNGGTTDKSSIIKRNTNYGGNLQVYTTSAANKPIACIHYSPSSLYTNGRLWFGEGTDVKYMMFPDITSNVKQVSTYEYVATSGYGSFPILRKVAGIPKTALNVGAITKSCSATDKIDVYYGLNGATTTTYLGSLISSPKPTTLTFNSGLGTVFYTIQFAVKLYRGGTATNSPELESLIFYYYPVPTRISSFTFDILATGDNAGTIFSEFETLLDTQTLVAFYPSGDTAKTSYNVKLTKMPSRSWWEDRGIHEGQFQCTAEEIIKD
uniref:Uncharacterized protein n=1 Tax=viral metagenome TaxID=1070528 RepID=A0A6M3J7H7_9ZZZZ